jgi:hypothetical protein
MIGVTGSGSRENAYADEVGPAGPQNIGTGNELEIVGGAESFRRLNHDMVPAPARNSSFAALSVPIAV